MLEYIFNTIIDSFFVELNQPNQHHLFHRLHLKILLDVIWFEADHFRVITIVVHTSQSFPSLAIILVKILEFSSPIIFFL
jgi:hypothetical protein